MIKKLFLRKPLKANFVELEEEHQGLKRHLGWFQLIVIGIGAIIGAGIFVITGKASAEYAGPAIVLSFVLASVICVFAGLCYAELSSLIPIAGGSYSYAYIAMGELPAWIIGWAVTGQYILSASTVAAGWSGYFKSFLKDWGLFVPDWIGSAPFAYEMGHGWSSTGSLFDLPAMLLVLFIGIMISIGIKAAAHFNSIMVVIKLCTVVLFLILGIPHIQPENWFPFIPENTGHFGDFGWSGIVRAAGLGLLCLHRLRYRIDSGPRRKKSPERSPARHTRIAHYLHSRLHHRSSDPNRNRELYPSQRLRSDRSSPRRHGLLFFLGRLHCQNSDPCRPCIGDPRPTFGPVPHLSRYRQRRASPQIFCQSPLKIPDPRRLLPHRGLCDPRPRLAFFPRRNPRAAGLYDDPLYLCDRLP